MSAAFAVGTWAPATRSVVAPLASVVAQPRVAQVLRQSSERGWASWVQA
eukprot:CAMPEP_0203941992 /NCGR_PEP_ID=MMETSP0359-20131031/78267_1 /ASSEMBLY_ACC=CAM_ASM_000338 /TAXON_ID=268821 /ORGANISM="Scrippsiella Hangoei, Strain SHTV-5" /LENGTH=48 /DNA_ID= /DNA_START= /DNA_END= /DNA_ORIENTATION=